MAQQASVPQQSYRTSLPQPTKEIPRTKVSVHGIGTCMQNDQCDKCMHTLSGCNPSWRLYL